MRKCVRPSRRLYLPRSSPAEMGERKTVEQFRQIIEPFIQKHLADHYYAYAIHDKFGELSNQRHPHVHIMFSERMIDDVKKIKERSACNFFK